MKAGPAFVVSGNPIPSPSARCRLAMQNWNIASGEAPDVR
jgi:hypothetical protein